MPFLFLKNRYTTNTMLLLAVVVLFGITRGAGAQVVFQTRPSQFFFPDSSETRLSYQPRLTGPLRDVIGRPDQVHLQRSTSRRIQYRVITEGDGVYQLFLVEHGNEFPVAGAGSYIIKRNRDDGSFEQVKIFLRTDQDFFVRVFPGSANVSRMDVVLAGDVVHRSVRVPLSFERILLEPFDMLADVSRHVVDWNRLGIVYDEDDDTRAYQIARYFAETGQLPDVYRSQPDSKIIPVDILRSNVFRIYTEQPGSIISGVIYSSEHQQSSPVTDRVMIVPYQESSGRFRMATFIAGEAVSIHSLHAQFSADYLHAEIYLPDAFLF